jgi:hypothetical protein
MEIKEEAKWDWVNLVVVAGWSRIWGGCQRPQSGNFELYEIRGSFFVAYQVVVAWIWVLLDPPKTLFSYRLAILLNDRMIKS